jgi:endonuclease G, mitochondrial
MKKILLLLFLISFTCYSFAQIDATTADGRKVILYPDGTWKFPVLPLSPITIIPHLEIPKPVPHEMVISHKGYTLSYDKALKHAKWVAYELTAIETKAVVERNNKFVPDPLLDKSISAANSDYSKSGYDKGHLAPAADMTYSQQTMVESFYLSNMSPQTPAFNRGIWKQLEEQVRQWAIDNKEVYIVTGGVLTNGLPTIGQNKIAVPQSYYKVILDYSEPEVKGIGFILPNKSSGELLQHFAVTIDSVEKVTNIDFFYQLPDDRENMIESQIDLKKWSW